MSSREEMLLENILGASNEIGAPHSRIEKIWQYALGMDGVVLDPPASRIEVLATQVAEAVRSGGGGGGYTPEQVQAMIDAAILDYQTNTEPGHISDAVDAAILDYQTNTEPQHIAAAEAAAIADYQANVEPGHIAAAEQAAVEDYEEDIENGSY